MFGPFLQKPQILASPRLLADDLSPPVGIIPAGSLKVVDIYLNELCNVT